MTWPEFLLFEIEDDMFVDDKKMAKLNATQKVNQQTDDKSMYEATQHGTTVGIVPTYTDTIEIDGKCL